MATATINVNSERSGVVEQVQRPSRGGSGANAGRQQANAVSKGGNVLFKIEA